ncbi:histidine kinase [Chitinivibrio alkaliphilus ACht1]|uniref:histidine kinase n=1 Tax=Chitinivibrio alkaliphilus ACht1 TaxID=1313304 RepID=U7DA50_9BACT|nr:histidine kinase [Chitinivibrio alkaliphilus ACht1]
MHRISGIKVHYSLCDYLTDIVHNSLEAGADTVSVEMCESDFEIRCTIQDNGCGMSDETLQSVMDPFYTDGKKHVHRSVGLGLPFLLQAAQACGGDAHISSVSGHGTEVSFWMKQDSVDLPPRGNIPATVTSLFSFSQEGNIIFCHRWHSAEYTVTRKELEDTLGELTSVDSLSCMKLYIESCEENLYKENTHG